MEIKNKCKNIVQSWYYKATGRGITSEQLKSLAFLGKWEWKLHQLSLIAGTSSWSRARSALRLHSLGIKEKGNDKTVYVPVKLLYGFMLNIARAQEFSTTRNRFGSELGPWGMERKEGRERQ